MRFAATSSSKFGEEFFEDLVLQRSRAIDADYTFVGTLESTENLESVRTIAVAIDGGLAENFDYELAGTPCEDVVGQKICSYLSGVADVFPKDVMLKAIPILQRASM